MFFEKWRDRYGWVIGALIIMTALAVMIAQCFLAQPPRIVPLVGLAIGLGIGGLLFSPALPRLIIAIRQFVIARVPTDTSGPFPVATKDVALPSLTAGEPALLVQIWYPAAANPSPVVSLSESMAPPPRSNALDDLRLADGHKQFLLLLYAPGNGGKKDDNASTAAELAVTAML